MEHQQRLAHVITYGCQMNEHDSEVILGLLEMMNFLPTDDPSRADIIVVNTCTVRDTADKRIIGHISHLNRYKLQNPDLIIAVGGCLVQDDDGRRRLFRRAPHVDIAFGTHSIAELPALIERVSAGERRVISVGDDHDRRGDRLPVSRAQAPRAWVNITFGCDNYCSYCIVPHVRGHMRSRPPEDVAAEAEDLAARGYREVFLLGQNVNAYGQDLGLTDGFAGLLVRLNGIDGLDRIRFTTSHPRDFTPELVDLVLDLEHVCEQFHLPVQSGSDRVLSAMNRGYDRRHYLDLTDRIRRLDPDAGLSTDIIVGFPGETDADFDQTLDLVRAVEFDQAFTFLYSPRHGTPAADMPGQVTRDVAKARLEQLMTVQNERGLARNRRLIGRRLEVLIEGPSRTDPDILSGRTRSNKLVHISRGNLRPGDLASIRVDSVTTWTLRGEVADHD